MIKKKSKYLITLFLPNLTGGGAEHVAVRLANALASSNLAVDLVLVQSKGPYLESIDDRVNVVDLKCGDRFSTLKSFPKLIKYLYKNKPSVLFSTLFRANVIVALAVKFSLVNIRLILRHPNMLYPVNDDSCSFYTNLIKRLAIRAAQQASAVVLTSQMMRDELVSLASFKPERLHVIPNPVPIDNILEMANKKLEHFLFENNSAPVILAVGRLSSQKGFTTLIKAFAEVVKKTSARLLILGEGEQRTELENLAKQLNVDDKIIMPGFVENPFSFMKHTAVFVLPSKWEGFPNVLVEAMACGAPIVATDCPGGSAEILEHGKWGRLVAVDSVAELAEAILKTIDDKDLPKVQQRVCDFSADKVIQQYLKVIFGH